MCGNTEAEVGILDIEAEESRGCLEALGEQWSRYWMV